MLFRIINGQVAYGATTILGEVNFEIGEKEKIAVVGRNGCGKTTLLKAITGEVELSDGTGDEKFSYGKGRGVVVGYLKQNAFDDENATLLEEILKAYSDVISIEEKMEVARREMENNANEDAVKKYSDLHEAFERQDGYLYRKEYETGIRKFGFTDEDKGKKLCEFSGGQRTKIALLRLVLSKPDILLLDEPTNHLDVESVEWLQDYVHNYKKSAVIVSHDRMFLDKTVSVVYEIEYGVTKRYVGNYTSFVREKRANYAKQLKDHDAQRKEIERLQKVIERFRYKATKASMVQSKIKAIEKMQKIDAPDPYDLRTFHADFQPDDTGVEKILALQNLTIGYDTPLGEISLELRRGQKLGVIGKNGVGKSTLLKTLAGAIPKLGGLFTFGVRTKIGYFDQQIAQRKSDKTVFDDFYDEFPKLNETEVRKGLGAFGFTGEDVFKRVSELSGGEKVKLQFCKMLRRKPNVLLLDEPTNHLDIVGKETLENMLINYKGTIIFVSHDRYFADKIADRILDFGDTGARFYATGYAEYLEEKARLRENTQEVNKNPTACKEKKNDLHGKYYNPLKERERVANRKKKIEEKLSDIDCKVNALQEEMAKPEVYSDYVKLCDLTSELNALKVEEDALMDEYFTLED